MSVVSSMRRRQFLRFSSVGALALVAATAGLSTVADSAAQAAAGTEAQRIADHFAGIRTMTGEFVQFGPRGEQTGGTFHIERPGKIRFIYEKAAGVQVISDGQSVLIDNKKLKTMDIYPLSKTPLKLLLGDRIDLSGDKVRDFRQGEDVTTLKLQDKSVFGNSTITMMFDPKSLDLRQWTIADAQGKETTVMIFNVKNGVTFDPSVFKIDYNRVSEMQGGRRR